MTVSIMTERNDIRWEQRFSNYNKALKKLSEAIGLVKAELNNYDVINEESENILTEIIKEGLIQRFEYTYEMARITSYNVCYTKLLRRV